MPQIRYKELHRVACFMCWKKSNESMLSGNYMLKFSTYRINSCWKVYEFIHGFNGKEIAIV